MTKKKLLLLISFVIPMTYISLSYADHCPNIKNVVKNGEWHCPIGWYIVEKQGKPNNDISKNTLELAEIKKWGKLRDISKNEFVEEKNKIENNVEPRVLCTYCHGGYADISKGVLSIAKNINVEPIWKEFKDIKHLALYWPHYQCKLDPVPKHCHQIRSWETRKEFEDIRANNGIINRRLVVYYQCGLFFSPKHCQWNQLDIHWLGGKTTKPDKV